MLKKTIAITITPSQLFSAYVSLGRQSILPTTVSVAKKFLKECSLLASCDDLKYVANLFYDYVGSTMQYEEGAEEAW